MSYKIALRGFPIPRHRLSSAAHLPLLYSISCITDSAKNVTQQDLSIKSVIEQVCKFVPKLLAFSEQLCAIMGLERIMRWTTRSLCVN